VGLAEHCGMSVHSKAQRLVDELLAWTNVCRLSGHDFDYLLGCNGLGKFARRRRERIGALHRKYMGVCHECERAVPDSERDN
jgi:hypothetical protein